MRSHHSPTDYTLQTFSWRNEKRRRRKKKQNECVLKLQAIGDIEQVTRKHERNMDKEKRPAIRYLIDTNINMWLYLYDHSMPNDHQKRSTFLFQNLILNTIADAQRVTCTILQCTNILHSLNESVGYDFDKNSLFCHDSENNWIIDGKTLGTNIWFEKSTSHL